VRPLPSPRNRPHNRLYRFFREHVHRLLRTYDVSLRWVLRHQFLILLVTFGTVCLNIYLFVRTPKGFFPQQGHRPHQCLIQGDQDLSFAAMSQRCVNSPTSSCRIPLLIPSPLSPAAATVAAPRACSPAQAAQRTQTQLRSGHRRIRSKTARIPGAALYLQSVQDLSVGGRFGGAQYQYTLQADNLVDLTHWAPSSCSACKNPRAT